MGVRCPAVGGQYVYAAAIVHAVFIGLIPGSLRDVDHARHNARCDAAGQDQCAALVVYLDFIPIPDPARGCIDWVDEYPLWKGFLQPVVVVVCGMDAMQRMVPDRLQRIARAVVKWTFPFLDVFWDRCALVKVKGSVFIVVVVGSSAAAYEVRISTGCA